MAQGPPGGFGAPPPGQPPGGYGGAPPGQPPGGYGGAPPGQPPPGQVPPGHPGAQQPWQQAQPMQPMGQPVQQQPLPGWVRVVGLVVLALGVLGLIGTVIAAIDSESAGVTMASITVGPLFFGIIVTAMSGKNATGSAAKPIGCGCGAWIAAGMAMFVFFAAIWPSL